VKLVPYLIRERESSPFPRPFSLHPHCHSDPELGEGEESVSLPFSPDSIPSPFIPLPGGKGEEIKRGAGAPLRRLLPFGQNRLPFVKGDTDGFYLSPPLFP